MKNFSKVLGLMLAVASFGLQGRSVCRGWSHLECEDVVGYAKQKMEKGLL